jgi:hypothetical protein
MTPSCLPYPTVGVRQVAGPNPVEYAVLFLVIVAGMLVYLR